MTKPWIEERQARHARKARSTTCPRCHTPVLIGPDADVMALPAVADPDPVSPADELRALVDGDRAVYDLIAGELERRDQWRTLRRYPVLLEHRCEEP